MCTGVHNSSILNTYMLNSDKAVIFSHRYMAVSHHVFKIDYTTCVLFVLTLHLRYEITFPSILDSTQHTKNI